jgi:hypothetical protein
MSDNIKVGVIGADIRVRVFEEDSGKFLDSPTVMKIYYRKKSGTTSFFVAIADGAQHIKYTTTSVDDINEDGLWMFESYVEMTGFKGYGTRVSKCVDDNLN